MRQETLRSLDISDDEEDNSERADRDVEFDPQHSPIDIGI